MRLAGYTAEGTFYFMGNHTIAERMYRHQPAMMLYAPLHTMIWDSPDGASHFTFDRPSDQFGSFGIPAIAAVGLELNRKLADLLDYLSLPVPEQLSHAQQGQPQPFSTASERATVPTTPMAEDTAEWLICAPSAIPAPVHSTAQSRRSALQAKDSALWCS